MEKKDERFQWKGKLHLYRKQHLIIRFDEGLTLETSA